MRAPRAKPRYPARTGTGEQGEILFAARETRSFSGKVAPSPAPRSNPDRALGSKPADRVTEEFVVINSSSQRALCERVWGCRISVRIPARSTFSKTGSDVRRARAPFARDEHSGTAPVTRARPIFRGIFRLRVGEARLGRERERERMGKERRRKHNSRGCERDETSDLARPRERFGPSRADSSRDQSSYRGCISRRARMDRREYVSLHPCFTRLLRRAEERRGFLRERGSDIPPQRAAITSHSRSLIASGHLMRRISPRARMLETSKREASALSSGWTTARR